MSPCPRWSRRQWLAAAPAWLMPGRATRAHAHDAFPTRPVKLWVPWPAGGATDVCLRLLAELAARPLGQRVIVENRGGAAGTLAMPILQQAEPDGYTLAQLPQPLYRAYFMQPVLWHPLLDVTPVIQVSGVNFGLLVRAESAFRELGDLLLFAQARPGTLTLATNGIGTSPHLVLEELFTARGLSYIHVPYRGVVEQVNAIASGEVMAGVSTGFGPSVEAGRVRLLATLAPHRSARWPAVPTLRELGHDLVARSPYGLGGPRGMRPEVVAVLHDAFKQAMFDPLFVRELAKHDQEPDHLGPEAYAASRQALFSRERDAVDRLGLVR